MPCKNISQHEKSINELSKREDFVFTKVDKGRAIVILNVEDYIKEGNKELKDQNYYERINHDPTHEHMKIINNTIETFYCVKVLAKNIDDNLKTTNVKHLTFT